MRVLLACRDAGAAQQLLAVVKALHRSPPSPVVDVRVLVDGPARQLFHDGGFPADALDDLTDSAVRPVGGDVLEGYLRRVAPEVVLTGVSAPGPSLEEAVTHVARRAGVPVIALQDYWGCCHDDRRAVPDLWLVLDDEAARLTRAQYPHVPCEVVGSPRHDDLAFSQLVPLQRGAVERRQRGGPSLVMFAGQPLWHLPAYEATLREIARVLAARGDTVEVRYAPHPVEPDCRKQVEQLFSEHGIVVHVSPMREVIAALCDIDLLLTAFSSCAWDLLQMHRHDARHAAVPVCTMWEPAVQEAHAAHGGGQRTVPYRAVLGELLVTSRDDLGVVIEAALQPGMRDALAARVRADLSPGEVPAMPRVIAAMQRLVP